MSVAVIIPSMPNRLPRLPALLASIRGQSCPPEEVVIAFSLGTPAIAHAVSLMLAEHLGPKIAGRVSWVPESANAFENCRRGCGLTEQPIISLTDPDSRLRPETLERALDLLSSSDAEAVIHGKGGDARPPSTADPVIGPDLLADMEKSDRENGAFTDLSVDYGHVTLGRRAWAESRRPDEAAVIGERWPNAGYVRQLFASGARVVYTPEALTVMADGRAMCPDPGIGHCIDYNFVEIGTSNFRTLTETAGNSTLGLAIEPLDDYLRQLPAKPGITKVNVAVSDRAGSAQIYYIPEKVIESHRLPAWFKGCNSMHTPHPLHVKHKILDLCKTSTVAVVTPAQLWGAYGIRRVGMLKIDTEGHDCIILNSLFGFLQKKNGAWPAKIMFETNTNIPPADVEATIKLYTSVGYVVESRGNDSVLRWAGG